MAVAATYRPPEAKLSGKQRVFEADRDGAARALASWANDIESRNWQGRFEDLTFFRYLTGRPANFSYNLSSIARPATVNKYQRATFTRPVKNIIAQCYHTLDNRVFKNRPALMVVPDAGDYDEQFAAIEQTRYLDAAFADGVWPLVEEATQDGACWGSGFVQVDTGLDGKTIRKRIVKKDEIIVDPAEAATGQVTQLAIRTFENRYALLAAFGDDPEAVAAINDAPKAQLGFYWDNDLDLSDIVVLREYWHLDPDGDTGRHILATDNYCFTFDDAYKLDHFPLAKFTFHRLGFFGKGGVEDSLGLQKEHNRMSLAIWENFRRMAYPRWFIPAGQGINEGELNDKSAGFVHFKDKPPEAAVAQAATPEQFEYLQQLERGIHDMWRVSDQAAAAQPLPGSNSGRARLVQDALDDRAHVTLLQHLEDFVTDLGYLLVEAHAKVKPTLSAPGRRQEKLKYPDFKAKPKIRAFPLSSVPQSIAGRQDWIDKAFAEGRISKETKTRLENLPDIDGETDLMDSSDMSVRKACFEMLKTGKYIPPNGFGDLDSQLAYVQAKVLLEQDAKPPAPPERLALLFRYAAALDELISDRDAQAATPGFGVQPPPGVPGTPTGQAPAPGLPTKPPGNVVA